MKQVWLSLFLVTMFTIACSGSETTENNTKQSELTSTPDPTEDVAVAITTSATEHPEGEIIGNEAATNAATASPTPENVSSTQTDIVYPTPATNKSNVVAKNEPIKPEPEPVQVEETTTTTTTTTTSSKPTTNTTTTTSKPTSTTSVAPKPAKPALSHDVFDALLRKYVNSSGNVNYGGFQKDKAKLASYLELLKNNPPQSSWSKNKEMAYWINMYNAITIHSIVESYPVSSIMKLEGGKIWDKKKIVINGENLTLNNIEKDKLLKRFKEPRVHFAVNCAAASCPPLLNKAWTEDNIQRYYDKQAKAFINNPSYNTVSAKKIEASQIFNWYAGDFGGSDKVVPYFQKYSETTIKDNAKVSYKEYDWNLNKQ
ncbi:DUF547 domain-containing protein [Aureispira sp. CCB-E]|uniref:DUF547 domain-containing protein n=1 Tax=Aureispira sp. CCB-E TaxID=3051121 RepID=UPI002868ED9E|nr:DUF547 domain-containing protein [Aureispira sp. CCB-E]WMX13848.1 DUF547 domain-containing protein [Aureispira sp. CCB-E]